MLPPRVCGGGCDFLGILRPVWAVSTRTLHSEPLNSVRGPSDGRYKFAFIEFGDQGSALDTSQRAVALNVIRQAQRPLLFVYIHGWMNNANSGDVCRFEHFIDMISRLPEVTQGKINVIGVYIAWRGKDLSVPGLDLLTFWNRKLTGGVGGGAKQLPGYY